MKNLSHIKEWYNKQPQADKDKLPALFAGAGLGLVAAQSLVFIGRPVAGYVFIAIGLFVAILMKKKVTLGPKWMYIPLLVIIGTVFLRATIYDVTIGTFEIGFMSLMFCAYLAGRVCGRQVFYLLPSVVLTLALFVYIQAIISPGVATGGMLDTLNYNLTVAVLIIGTILTTWQRKWVVVAFTLPAIFLTGAAEGIFTVAIIFVLFLMRKDWSQRLWLPVGTLSIVFLASFYSGAVDTLYARATSIVTEVSESSSISKRVEGFEYALTDIKVLGHGYNPTNTNKESIHNVPLRVLHELGPLAAVAWCYAMLVGLIKTRYKYAFAAILAFSVFDHLMWTWLAPYAWVVAGVATVDNEGDFLFRKESV